jgi:hypothetical protein
MTEAERGRFEGSERSGQVEVRDDRRWKRKVRAVAGAVGKDAVVTH